jgi:hypothetical protein
MVMISRSHREGRGSIPRVGMFFAGGSSHFLSVPLVIMGGTPIFRISYPNLCFMLLFDRCFPPTKIQVGKDYITRNRTPKTNTRRLEWWKVIR